MTAITSEDAARTAEGMIEARAAEILGHRVDRNEVVDILHMIAAGVGFRRRYAESDRFGPDHTMTLAFLAVAERLQRGL